ncbi:MAG TPA: hypothetical protein VFQ61_02175, partial [Polyangiaceae bacterium]|nr:hypothetical protein [Polyangiaceae bacterium]
MRWSYFPVASALLARLLCAEAAQATPRLLELTFEAPAECGSAERVEAAVGELVGTKPPRSLRASLFVRHEGSEYRAELRTGPEAIRVMRGLTCDAVVEASAIVLALAIEPHAASARRAVAPSANGSTEVPADVPRSRLHPLVSAGPIFDTSTLPHVALGAELRAGISGVSWSASARGHYWLPASGSLESDAALGGRFTWWTIGISGCLGPARTRFSVCLTPELGRMTAEGQGADEPQRGSATWLALALEPNLMLPLTSVLRFRASA